MPAPWQEVQIAKSENRHEIKLAGAAISERINKDGIDVNIFSLTSLNLLNISDTCLASIPDEISALVNLQTLLLFANKLAVFNKNICKLTKLKVLDLSRNELTAIPEEIGQLTQLTNVNLSSNQIESFPATDRLTSLITLDLSNNRLAEFPDVCFDGLSHFSDLKLSSNRIEIIPGKISILPALKNLDISENCIKIVPYEVSNILKLKEINIKGNSLTDKRLAKLVDQCRTKQVVDYVRQHSPKSAPDGNQSKSGGKKSSKKAQMGKRPDGPDGFPTDENSIDSLTHRIQVLHFKDDVRNVKITDAVKLVRPHIVCCIVNGLNFSEQSFRKFIQMQTKLHDTVCEKRNTATIATHDISKLVSGDLLYTARAPEKIEIVPLMRNKKYTGQQLFLQLQQEAENLRKEKKRNVYSGIHKFLYLLEGKPVYPCLEDSAGNVISFPPMTNSDITKMSHESKAMLVEVTSAASQGICKSVTDTFLKETLLLGVTQPGECPTTGPYQMEVQQLRVIDLDGNMKIVYPSRADLNFEESEAIRVVRD